MKRRDALKTIGGLAGAAALSRVLPACGSGGNSKPGEITTYVYMMMENRSYDHVFGARSMLEGKPGDGPRMDTALLDINDQPVTLWQPAKDEICDLDPPHGWETLRASWNEGACDQFLKVHQREHARTGSIHPMQYLTREELPVSYALADAYTTCDRWFCSAMGPTWPNRYYWHAGQGFGKTYNTPPDSGLSPSIYHRLIAKGVDWAYFHGGIPGMVGFVNDLDISQNVRRMRQFFEQAAAGTLPPVVYIDPGFAVNDDHPPIHPVLGQQLIASVYTALAASPQWPNILFLVTYDENGGFYDHVSPPKLPDDHAADGFDQCGFRVPTMVMGPYVKQGHVSSVQYDHTSALRHLMNVFELDELTARTAAANDLTDCIDQERLAAGDWAEPIELPPIDVGDWPMNAQCVGSLREEHPILAWANANPDRVAAFDLRSETADYQRTITDFLKNPPRPAVKRF
jgi:phospholipase C